MARRVAKNANDEGIEGPPKSPLANEAYNSRSVPGTVPGTTLVPGTVPGTVPLPGMGSVPGTGSVLGTATVPVTPPGPAKIKEEVFKIYQAHRSNPVHSESCKN
ncbi:hypothetical protein G9C98_000912 [Cotesia typhae]|uniref:Uncharacterized protein n=1 Tax=Cotesia typhae TaxID=2053667 RepID=A0A8J5RFN7_9HYME|nr:hypothetical protein G9C98_000912 [Cotesia typhae]